MKLKRIFALFVIAFALLFAVACDETNTRITTGQTTAQMPSSSNAESTTVPQGNMSIQTNATTQTSATTQATTAPHVHVYGEWSLSKVPTTKDDGEEIRSCDCGEAETRIIPATGSLGLEYNTNYTGGHCIIVGMGTCTDTEIYIPKYINGYKVTGINFNAFKDRTSITHITIPDSVTYIADYAFAGCTSLTNVTIPDSVNSIGKWAFSDCKALASITIPASVTSIDECAFFGCFSLTGVYTPDISAWLNIEFKESTSNPLFYAKNLYIKNNLVTELKIPDSVTSIGGYAFAGCSSIKEITIPDSVTSIGIYAFDNCSSLTGITIPDSVTSIGGYAFAGCSSIKEITIPKSVTSIDYHTFRQCSNLTTVIIPNGVTLIKAGAFMGCSGLTSIIIPASVTDIEKFSFSSCTDLTKIDFLGTTLQWNNIYKKSGWNTNSGDYTIYCTDGTIAKDGTVTYN